MIKHIISSIVLLFLVNSVQAQSAHSLFRSGDGDYKNGDFTTAEENYRKGLEKERSSRGTYNLGNSIYRQERIDEAARQYLKAAEDAQDEATKSRAYHNLGNSLYQMEDYENSIGAFKNALRHNPKDVETKYNLAQAQRQYRIQQQQQQQQQEQQQSQDQEQEEQDENQENQSQEDQQQQQQEQQQSESDSEEQQNQEEQQGQEQELDMTREEAEQLLEILEKDEQKVQEKLRKGGNKKKPEKDW